MNTRNAIISITFFGAFLLLCLSSCKKGGVEQRLLGVWHVESVKEQGSFLGKKDISSTYKPGQIEFLPNEEIKASFNSIIYTGVWRVKAENTYQADGSYQTQHRLTISLHSVQNQILISGLYSIWNNKLTITDQSAQAVLHYKFYK